LAQVGLAGEVGCRQSPRPDGLADRLAERALGLQAEQRHRSQLLAADSAGSLNEAFRHPPLSSAVGRAGTDADHRQRYAQFSETRGAAPGCPAGSVEADLLALRQRVDQAGAAQQLQIVEALMARNLARLGDGDRVGKQPSPAIAIVSDAARNPR